MSEDPTIKAMLLSYDKTAQRLMDGERIEGEDLYRFLGITGVLSVQMQRQLWTQEELRKQIKEQQDERCLSCPNSMAIAALTRAASTPTIPPPSAPESKQDIWTMLATEFAKNMRLFIWLVVTAALIVTLAIIVTDKIEETGKAVAAATNQE